MPSDFFPPLSLGKRSPRPQSRVLLQGEGLHNTGKRITTTDSVPAPGKLRSLRTRDTLQSNKVILSAVVFLLPVRSPLFFFFNFYSFLVSFPWCINIREKPSLEYLRPGAVGSGHGVRLGLRPEGQFSFSLHPRAFFPNLYTSLRPSTRSRISLL